MLKFVVVELSIIFLVFGLGGVIVVVISVGMMSIISMKLMIVRKYLWSCVGGN